MIKWIYSNPPRSWLLCFLVSSLLACGLGLLFPYSSASASELVLSQPVEYVETINVDKWYCVKKGGGQDECGGQTGLIFNKNFTDSALEWTSINSSSFVPIEEGNYYVIHLSFLRNTSAGTSNTSPFPAVWQLIDNSNFTAVSIKQLVDTSALESLDYRSNSGGGTYNSYYGNSNYTYEIILRARRTGNYGIQAGDVSKTLIYADLWSEFRIFTWPSVQVYKSVDDGSSSIVSAIGTTNQKLDTQIDLQRQANEAQQEANDNQQEQYEAEKQEEADREEAAQDSQTGDFLGSIDDVLFPFTSIFNGLGSSSCFTPTNVNNWLNTPGRQYCPWFSSSVSTAVSSVCLGLVSIIIFGFVVKWLNGSDSNG